MFQAAKDGDISGVQLELETGGSIRETDSQGRSLVHIAVERQDEALLQYLITEPGVNLNMKDDFGATPLYLAVSKGYKSIALLLAENGADIDGDDDEDDEDDYGLGDTTGGGAGGSTTQVLDDEIDAVFQDLGFDVDDLDLDADEPPQHDMRDEFQEEPHGGASGGGGGGGEDAWDQEMADMDAFLNEAVGDSPSGGGGGGGGRVIDAQDFNRGSERADAQMQVERQGFDLVETQYDEHGGAGDGGMIDIDDVDNLLGDMRAGESVILAHSTDLIVNQDAISNCLIDFVSLFCKTGTGTLNAEELEEFVSLAEYYRDEIIANAEKFGYWLETLENENLVSLHANRNQLKQSSAALTVSVKEYTDDPSRNMQKELLVRAQTVAGDAWSFYVNTNDPWSYDHVVFYHIEELIKVVKRLMLAAKCESGEDWITVCLLAANQSVLVSRVCNFISFSKRNLQVQKDMSNAVVMIAMIIKRMMQAGDEYRLKPNPRSKNLLEQLQKAFIGQVKTIHMKVRAPVGGSQPVVYTPEILMEFAKGYKNAAKTLLDAIDNYCALFGSSLDVDVQEMIELGEFISRDVSKMAKLFRDVPSALVVNILNIAFNISKLARIIVKWSELQTTNNLTRDLLLSSMQTSLNYSIQAKLLTTLKCVSYPVVEIESSTYTAIRGLALAVASLYDACCFLEFDEESAAPLADDPNAVAHATSLCLHFGRPTPVERAAQIEDAFLDNPDLNLQGAADTVHLGDDGDADLNADDLLNSVEDLLSDPSLQQRTIRGEQQEPEPQQQEEAPAPEEDSDEDWPDLEPLPINPPPLSDIEGYKDYMRLKYEHQQRENAILLRDMKREKKKAGG